MARRRPASAYIDPYQHLPKYRVAGTWPGSLRPYKWSGDDRARARRIAQDLHDRGATVTAERRTTGDTYRPVELHTPRPDHTTSPAPAGQQKDAA